MPGDLDEIPFTNLSAEVRARFGITASYHRLWGLAVSAMFPTRRDGRRLMVPRSALPEVAAALGHRPADSTPAAA